MKLISGHKSASIHPRVIFLSLLTAETSASSGFYVIVIISNHPWEWNNLYTPNFQALFTKIRPAMRADRHTQVCTDSGKPRLALTNVKLVSINFAALGRAVTGVCISFTLIAFRLWAVQILIFLLRLQISILIQGVHVHWFTSSDTLTAAISFIVCWAFSCNKGDPVT